MRGTEAKMDGSFWRGRRVLITGGMGFIGSHLAEHLLRSEARVRVASRTERSKLWRASPPPRGVESLHGDLRDPEFARRCTRDRELVLHFASRIAGLSYNRAHHAEMMAYNTVLDLQVLHAAAENGVPMFVYPSGALVYDTDCAAPIGERTPTTGPPLESCKGASWAKRTVETAVSFFREEFAMKIWIVRFSNLYGPGDDFRPETAHLIGNVMRQVASDQPPEIWGDGSQLRSYLYVDDAIRALDLWLRKGTEGAPVNIGGTTEYTVRDIVSTIIDISRKPMTAKFRNDMPTGLSRKLLDVGCLQRLTGFQEQTPLREGLRATYAWYIAH